MFRTIHNGLDGWVGGCIGGWQDELGIQEIPDRTSNDSMGIQIQFIHDTAMFSHFDINICVNR